MTKTERYIYDMVKSTPWLKDLIRNIYQSFFDLLPKKKELFADEYDYKENFFLGFHDVQPFSEDGTKVLAQRAEIEGHMPSANDVLHVGYLDFKDGHFGAFHHVADSFAWNFHKGCRLQWKDTDHLIFNTRKENNVYAVSVNILTNITTPYSFPIDTVSPDGQYATTLNYHRLEYLMPGYGYLHMGEEEILKPAPANDGLYIVKFENEEKKLLFSYKELAEETDNTTQLFHYITHSSFSKDGRYIACLHRYISLQDKDKRTTRLIIYDQKTSKHFSLPTQGMVSHYVWNSDNQIVAYCRIDGQDCHALFSIAEGKCVAASPTVPTVLNSDGHQSFIDNNSFVTDTYPDKYRMAKLYKVDIPSHSVTLLASVYSPKQFQTKDMYNHIACDLHPRVSRDGKFVCFDSPRTSVRSLYIIKCK